MGRPSCLWLSTQPATQAAQKTETEKKDSNFLKYELQQYVDISNFR